MRGAEVIPIGMSCRMLIAPRLRRVARQMIFDVFGVAGFQPERQI